MQALPPHAVAEAAAAVAAPRLAGELGQGPLDASIPRDAGPAPNPARPAQARESRR